jgi:AcrR family transcriptional regulator
MEAIYREEGVVPRRPDPKRREALVEAVAGYVLQHGVADLSLRPVADALGVSTYSLVYHFGSKDGLIAAVVAHIEERQRAMAAGWAEETQPVAPGAVMRRYWHEWCLPEALAPYHRLFYEVYVLSLREPERFPGFLERGGAEPWLAYTRAVALRAGLTDAEADVVAWLMATTVAGALLALLGTGDREMSTRTVESVAEHLDHLTSRARERRCG